MIRMLSAYQSRGRGTKAGHHSKTGVSSYVWTTGVVKAQTTQFYMVVPGAPCLAPVATNPCHRRPGFLVHRLLKHGRSG